MPRPLHLRPARSAPRGRIERVLCEAWRWLRPATLLPILAFAAGAAEEAEEAEPQTSASCLECHGDPKITAKTPAHAQTLLFVDERKIATSAHAAFDCIDCHEGIDGRAEPHRETPAPVDCFSCHDDTGKKHKFHGQLMLNPPPAGKDTACAACHGGHEIAAIKSPAFAFAPARLTESCSQCHQEAGRHFLASAHGRALAAGDPEAPNCLTCHNDPAIAKNHALPDITQKLAQTKLCTSCHVETPAVASQALRGSTFVGSFDQSVHGAALLAGKQESANCVDCHGAHEMNRAMVADARMNKQHVADSCAQCHEKQAREFGDSVHAGALHKGNVDSASCTDCHGEHDIRGHTDPLSPVNEKNVAQQVCANCHDSLRLTQKYGLPANSFQTFADSYHGLAVRGGAVEVVNCASCHSSHAIKSQLDPTSSIHPTNLIATCGECHPGANKRFAVGKVHVSPEAPAGAEGNSPILYLISTVYVTLIVVVVGGMFLHNLLDFLKKIRRKLAIQKGLIAEEHVAHRLYLRMTAHERVQHGVLVLSFTALVVTGFMLRYPEAWWVVAIRNTSERAFEWRSLIHRVAGVVLLVAGAWHAGYLVFTKPGRALLRDLLPRGRDFVDPFRVLKYNVGLAPTKPKFGRFCYIEKAEYWAMMWGSLLMGVTGVVLWFDNTSIGLFTKLGFDISRTIHFYEAILATLAIVVWHFYFVIFNPDIYPMNLAWLTGRISEEEMLHEHPLELERLKAEEAKAPPSKAADPKPPEASH